MTSRPFKILVFLALSSQVVGCRLAVIVTEGGDVESLSGTRNCPADSVCEFEVNDTSFSESFTAIPSPGYVFTRWKAAGNDFFCADSVNPVCTLSNVGTAGNAGIEAIIASYKMFHIMPEFEFVGIDTDGDGVKDHIDLDDDDDGIPDLEDLCPLDPDVNCGPGTPITGTVIANGKEWAQVDLFLDLSWSEVNAVCPGGACVFGGVLNGYRMTGWTWASVDDLNALFNFYIGSLELGPGPDQLFDCATLWGTEFYDDGWRPTQISDDQPIYWGVVGFTSDAPSDDYASESGLSDYRGSSSVCVDHIDSVLTGSPRHITYKSGWLGGWFYRSP